MSVFWELAGYALLAVFAENLVLAEGIGTSRMLRAARKPKQLLLYAGLVCLFSLCTALITRPLDPLIDDWPRSELYRPLVYSVCACALYLVSVLLLKAFRKEWFQKVEDILPSASLNCIVIALPYLASTRDLDLGHTLALSLGAGAGFAAAAWLAAEGIRRIDNKRMAKAFLGLPALFLYLAILSLALMGLGGKGILPA